MRNDEQNLKELTLAPWILKATALISVGRKVGGNTFRHQIATLGILLDYKYYSNSVLLKASVIHDLIEDVEWTDENELRKIDFEANKVVDLVLEVTRKCDELKSEYLKRILKQGSINAKTLKTADRISNLTDLNLDIYTQSKVSEYLDETETYVLPMAREVNSDMFIELTDLISIRRKLLVHPFNE